MPLLGFLVHVEWVFKLPLDRQDRFINKPPELVFSRAVLVLLTEQAGRIETSFSDCMTYDQ